MKSSGRPVGNGGRVAGGGGVGSMHSGKKQRKTFSVTFVSLKVRSTLLRRRRWLFFPDTTETEQREETGDKPRPDKRSLFGFFVQRFSKGGDSSVIKVTNR